jgi:radical SAM superfamily enzyme YgiQ (UPF0313 family)
MNICLVFPKSTFLIDPMVYPPLGLWYLAAQLEAQGHQCDFRDLTVDEFPSDGDYDQVWISATSPQMSEVRRLAALTSQWSRSRSVFGGAAPWARPDECTVLGFNLTVTGESDHPSTVRQIITLAQQAHGGHIAPAITAGELSWVLPPVRRWDTKYHATLQGRDGRVHRTTTLFTSRGCPMACAFCESGRNGVIWDRFVRYEPVALVERQVKEAVERGHTGLMFYDDILPLNKPRTLAIMNVLKRYGVIWRCFLRTDVIMAQGGFDYLKEMSNAGLVEVLAGVESADNRIKKNIHKGTTIEQDTAVLGWCKTLGIKFKASFILGLPGEDMESMQRTREWILEHRPDRVDVNALIPFPGTPITRTEDYMGVKFDLKWEEELPEEFWYKGPRDKSNVVVSTSALTSQQIGEFRDSLIRDVEAAGIPY